ncbi:MAG: TldD/PmbA family protein [Nitrososphaerota archaeon]|nr:TldD/PmbA family protein [Aigarchaeota archaeon]MDW8076594.1 TldD/PmbA family protein [Nitrososphaerota archaeon]
MSSGSEIRELPRKLVRKILKLGASDVATKLNVSNSAMIRFSNNDITISNSFKNVSLEIYVAFKERRVTGTITDLSQASIERTVEQLISTAKTVQPSDVYAPLPNGPFKYDKRLLKVGKVAMEPEVLVDHVSAAVNSAISAGAKRVAGSLRSMKNETILCTSGNVEISSTKSAVAISVRAFAADNATGQFATVAASDSEFRPEEVGSITGEIANMALNPVEGEPGSYETILGPMTFAHIVDEVGSAASAFNVDTGVSFFIDVLGKQVASQRFTLIDDPTLYNTYGAEPFDDEGLPTRRNVIIENGTLKTYLHNSTTAKRHGTTSTANAGIIVPTPFNLVVDGGDKSFEKLISGIDKGIYVTNDWYLRYSNYREGDFSTVPRDGLFMVKNGSIEKPLKGLRLVGNMIKLLNSITALSTERYWIEWWEVETPVYAPWALIAEVEFTKSTL